MEIILFQPDIPQNTGNIARTCAATSTRLILVRPLGFSLGSRLIKRSGMDYWHDVDLQVVDDLSSILRPPCYFLSTRGKKSYTEVSFEKEAQLIFGSETHGLTEEIYTTWENSLLRIPMVSTSRSLNLSNAVAIVLYEALRQHNFW